MSSVKIKFRASKVVGNPGTLYYQVIHKRRVRHIGTELRVFPYEWSDAKSDFIMPENNPIRCADLERIRNMLRYGVQQIFNIIALLESSLCDYSVEDIVRGYRAENSSLSVEEFMEEIIDELRKLDRNRLCETYQATMNSFNRFSSGHKFMLKDLNSKLMMHYERWLLSRGIRRNTSSFYMRNLRAVYNRAVERNLVEQAFPFKHVYTGVDKTIKRAISIDVLREIKEIDLSLKPSMEFARDMFLFSFYTRGMSFVDMAYLKKSDLKRGLLKYCRRKTKQQILIKWESCMQEIVNKYDTSGSIYLLPIIDGRGKSDRLRYLSVSASVNRNLKSLGNRLNLSLPLTTYVARHAWASIAHSKNIPLSIISEGMGHDNEATTRIYLSSLDNESIDRANSSILELL